MIFTIKTKITLNKKDIKLLEDISLGEYCGWAGLIDKLYGLKLISFYADQTYYKLTDLGKTILRQYNSKLYQTVFKNKRLDN